MTERQLILELYNALDYVLSKQTYQSQYDEAVGHTLTAAEDYLDAHAYNAEGEEYFDR